MGDAEGGGAGRNYGQYERLQNAESTERFRAYADSANFVEASHFYPKLGYGEAFGGIDKECQVTHQIRGRWG